jgi:hypothetical protein
MTHCASVTGAQARFRRIEGEVRGETTSHARIGDSGKKTTFHFCCNGGAIPLGAFADPAFPRRADQLGR